jgi:hypothetical protein
MLNPRHQRKVESDFRNLAAVASHGNIEEVGYYIHALMTSKEYSEQNLSLVIAKALIALHRRCEFFEVTLHDAMANHIDYLLTLGPDKVSSDHIEGATKLMKLVEELMKQRG